MAQDDPRGPPKKPPRRPKRHPKGPPGRPEEAKSMYCPKVFEGFGCLLLFGLPTQVQVAPRWP
eukprot:836408-Pyramimonas_sp.AAC.1